MINYRQEKSLVVTCIDGTCLLPLVTATCVHALQVAACELYCVSIIIDSREVVVIRIGCHYKTDGLIE